jgi:hypothetical protein
MAALAALAVLTMLSVQGCDPGTAAQATPGTAHAVTIAAAQAVYQAYLTNSDQAAADGNRIAGLADVSDAQWETVHAQYNALASTDVPVPRYQYGSPDFYVPALSGYPRWFAVSVPRRPLGGNASGNVEVTTLMVFEKAKPSAVWTLDGTTALQAGQSLPMVTRDSAGYATALPAHDQNLLLPPDVVGATQAAVVDDGPASAAAAVVTPGPQTTGLYAQESAYASTQKASGRQYLWLMQGASFPEFALRLADGGALVLYGIYLNTTTQHPNLTMGPPIPVPANFAPLLPARTQIGYHAVYANWTYQFAAIDPPATAHNQKLTVIAATGGPSYGHAY